jgi:hypothetical protein
MVVMESGEMEHTTRWRQWCQEELSRGYDDDSDDDDDKWRWFMTMTNKSNR